MISLTRRIGPGATGASLALAALLALAACGRKDEQRTDETTPDPVSIDTSAPNTAEDETDLQQGQTQRWAIATANPNATQAGAKILRDGGSAVDAAVAVQAMLGLVEPQSSGLGGGAFMLYYDAETGEITAYDGREMAPASATPDMFLLDDGERMGFYDAVTSGKSVGVPGVVAMLEMAHLDHGKLSWAELFTPAMRLASQGFEVSPRLAGLIKRFDRLSDNPSAKALFFDTEGEPLEAGAFLVNTDYAETLSEIAEGGADAFYNGIIAQLIVTAVNNKAGDGTMTLDDVAGYEPKTRPVICGGFLTYQVCSMGPPSSGGVSVLQILGLFERAVSSDMPRGAQWARYVEASRLAYADRAVYLADPTSMTFGNLSSDDVVNALVAPTYLDARASLIGSAAAETAEAGDPIAILQSGDGLAPTTSPELPGTSHFSIRDQDGNIVSMTTTVEFAFGSHLVAGGMILNNQLTDFSFVPERDGVPVANAVGPGKRPRSSMSPVIVLDENGAPVIAIGSPGGPAIIGYVAKTLIASLWWDMPLQAAVEVPHLTTPRGQIFSEEGASEDRTASLSAYGFDNIRERSLASGLYGFRLHSDGTVEGAADPRREGTFLIADDG